MYVGLKNTASDTRHTQIHLVRFMQQKAQRTKRHFALNTLISEQKNSVLSIFQNVFQLKGFSKLSHSKLGLDS